MNWLAHLRLAPDKPLLRIGNLAGDFVRPFVLLPGKWAALLCVYRH